MAVRISGAGVALTVGIILVTGLIIGGFFWARNSGEQARNDEAAKIAQEQLEEQSNEDVALNEGDENKDETKDESQTGGSGQDSATDSEGDMPATGTDASEETTVDELPATGANDASAAFVLALVAFSVAAYIQSRRQLQ